ncbi:MAG: uridylate kinase [Methylophilaceae bacterium]|nr:uridylate kinase [Methylophilaceae bacterium]
MWVVKLGGSLLGTPELQDWLDVLVSEGDGRVVVVPGGGPFADAVRTAQRVVGFGDAIAHQMALLAMEQYGLMLKGMQPALAVATSELAIAERGWQHRAMVWLPSQMVMGDETIPKSWEVTSDSLAAWLAAKLEASHLILVKHAGRLGDVMPAALLSAAGVLDAAFETFGKNLACPVRVVDKSEHAAFARALRGGPLPGTRIAVK